MTIVKGCSTANIGTCIFLPEFKTILDIGNPLCAQFGKADTIVITHEDEDHFISLPYHLYQSFRIGGSRHKNKNPITLYIPNRSKIKFKRLIRDLEDVQRGTQRTPYSKLVDVIGYDDGDEMPINKGKIKFFKTEHRGLSHGIALFERVSKKSESARQALQRARDRGVARREMKELGRRLRDRGEIATTWKHSVTYTSDTDPSILDDPIVTDAKHVIVESTFLRDEDCEKAHKRGHSCLSDIKTLLSNPKLDAKNVTITHFSVKHDEQEIRDSIASLYDERVSWVSPCTI